MSEPAPVALSDDLPADALAHYHAAQNELTAAHTKVQMAHKRLVAACQHPYYLSKYDADTDTLGNNRRDTSTTTYRCALCASTLLVTKGSDRSRPKVGREIDINGIEYASRDKVYDKVMRATPLSTSSLLAIIESFPVSKYTLKRS